MSDEQCEDAVTHPAVPVGAATPTAYGDLEFVPGGVRLADRYVPLTHGSVVVLRLLAERPGRVVPRSTIGQRLPRGATTSHAVEASVSRLRAALGVPGLVETVFRRGYRLATSRAVPASHGLPNAG